MTSRRKAASSSPKSTIKLPPAITFLKRLGPGLITGAADDDPSGIATYSQVGAMYGYAMLWTLFFSFPFMAAIQEISGRIGRVTGHGIAGNVRRYYSRWLLYTVVSLLFVVNTINLGVDLQAMAASLELLIRGPVLFYTTCFALFSLVMEIWVPYRLYVSFLRWLTFALLAYVGTVFAVKVSWGQALKATLIPSLALNREALTALMAVLGTTISPYLFFWQASQEAEEVQDHSDEHPLKGTPREAPGQLRRIHTDTYLGMGVSNLIAFFIMLTSAVTLHVHGTREIGTAAQAAQALEPLVGRGAFLLFALGIIGTGLLAVPVLAGSAAYALGEAFHWPVSLEKRPGAVKNFCMAIAVANILGVALTFFHMNPIKALYWTAVINGIVAVPAISVMLLLTANRAVMGGFVISPYLKVMGWLTMSLMLAATLGMGFLQ